MRIHVLFAGAAAAAAAAAAGPPISTYAPVFDPAAVPPTPPTGWPSAVPHWPRYDSRVVTVLNGTWAFGFADAGTVDPATVPYAAIATPNTTTVPGSFDVAPMGISGPIGTAMFRSVHACTPGASALLKFGAVNHYARVFVDGVVVGNHTAGPYTPFELLAGACGAHGTRELLVVCNNEKNSTLSPTYTGGDFYFYSGIIRPVIVTELPASPYWIASVGPLTVDYTRGLIDIRVAMGGGADTSSVHLAFAFNGAALGNATTYAVVGGVAVIPSVAVPGYKLWTPGADNRDALFTLTVQDSASKDTLTVRSAVRQVGVDAASARITINGAALKLLGFNRHTLAPDTGAALTHAQEAADMALLKALNATYVREGVARIKTGKHPLALRPRAAAAAAAGAPVPPSPPSTAFTASPPAMTTSSSSPTAGTRCALPAGSVMVGPVRRAGHRHLGGDAGPRHEHREHERRLLYGKSAHGPHGHGDDVVRAPVGCAARLF